MAVNTACDGTSLTGITYNVYIVPAPGPVPTLSNTSIPCGIITMIDKAKVTPANTAPITQTSFKTSLTEGSYVAVVEAVSATGAQGASSAPVSFTVVLRPISPAGSAGSSVTVGP